MFVIRLSLFLVSILSFSNLSSASVMYDAYYEEIRDLTLEGHNPLTEYREARSVIMQQIALKRDHKGYFVQDVYCKIICRKGVGPRKMPSSGMINIEHTWPQSRFNKRMSRSYQKSDLHHLYPTDSKANGKRGNHKFSEFKNGRAALSHCQASKVGTISGTGVEGFEPPQNHKGNVARALFYFSMRYNIRISDYEEIVLRQWNMIDPVDTSEKNRNDIIESIQGNRNPFIDEPEFVDLISNF